MIASVLRCLVPCSVVLFVVACSGDDTSTADSEPSSTPGDTSEEVRESTSRSVPDTSSGPSSEVLPVLNPCGGEGELRHLGVVAAPLAPCGAFDEGVLICNGTEALRCVGETPVNDCGGTGVLPVEIGTACGPCGGGTWVCDPSGGGARCVGDGALNACGGCSALDAGPAEACEVGGAPGLWVCDGSGGLTCMADALNACGGASALRHEGADALPGDACDVGCSRGILTCDGPEALTCVATADTEPENACGGCGPLPGKPGDECGFCGNGQWTCGEDGTMACAGADAPNACGGCEAMPGIPGEVCGAESRWLCDGASLSCSPRADGLLNACGGATALEATPGEPCGACGLGVSFCTGFDALGCSVADDKQQNACGGCDVLVGRAGNACGDCGDGTLTCAPDSESLVCEGAEQVRNACGGCGVALEHEPGTACGTCGTWECASTMTVRCRGEADLDTDAENCGFCGNACFAGDTCVAGVCANACGGDSALAGVPGEACGTCGVWECDGAESVTCAGDTDTDTDAENCGTCGNACDAQSGCVAGECSGPNACGGFGVLPAEPGTTCESCGIWSCDGVDALRCVGGADLRPTPSTAAPAAMDAWTGRPARRAPVWWTAWCRWRRETCSPACCGSRAGWRVSAVRAEVVSATGACAMQWKSPQVVITRAPGSGMERRCAGARTRTGGWVTAVPPLDWSHEPWSGSRKSPR